MQMPRPFEQKGPNRLQVRDGGGCLSVFGIPFFAAGVFVTLLGLRVIPLSNARDLPFWAWPVLLLMGLVFTAAGGGLVFGRRWITLDTASGSVLKQWGLLVPLRAETLSLGDYDAVSIRFSAGDSDSPDRYPVVLKAKSGSDLTLYTSTSYAASRQQAVGVAEFLRFPLEDASTGHATVFSPGQADASFQQRLSGASERREEAVRPLAMRSEVQDSGAEARITIPGPGFRPASLLPFAIPMGFLVYLGPEVARFFDRTHTPPPVQIVFLGFGAFLLGFLPLMGLLGSILRAVRSRTVITATSEGITLTEQGAWRAKSTTIPAADILDLDYSTAQGALASAQVQVQQQISRRKGAIERPPGMPGPPLPGWLSVLNRLVRSRGVTIKTRQGLFTFGAGLPDEEVAYLNTVVARALSAGAPRSW